MLAPILMRICGALMLAFYFLEVTNAAVVESAPNRFIIKNTVSVSTTTEKAYAALVDIGHWWDPAHTYSENAANLSIDTKPGGCFCEKLPGGGVLHMTVINAIPGKILRLSGGLGPLQAGSLSGTLTFSFKTTDTVTEINLNYLADGYLPGGLDSQAKSVDEVLNIQMQRLKRFIETGHPQSKTP